MPTIGDIVLKRMKETKPGIKGTESETLGDWIFARKKERESKKAPWFSWLLPTTPGARLGSVLLGGVPSSVASLGGILTLGRKIFGKKEEKPLVQPWEKTELGVRGYSQEDIDKATGGQIRVDMRRILEQPGGAELTSKGMAEMLRGMGHSDEAIRNAGVKL